MAEEVVLMKGNAAIAHSAIPSPPNRKYWKLLPTKNLGKLPVW